jgi:hypothetical protein
MKDDYTIMGTIVEPMHEYNISKFDTYVPSENWHTPKQRLVHLTLQGEQNVHEKVPPTYFTIEPIALSPPNKRPMTITKSLIQMMVCVSKGKNLHESLPLIQIP